MSSLRARVRPLLTPGHAAALAGLLVVAYHLWGMTFVPGGTGSNVVLGLLAAIAGLVLGTSYLGPRLDDLRVPEHRRQLRRRARDLQPFAHEVGELVRRARAGKAKRLDGDGATRVAGAHQALVEALAHADAVARAGSPAEAEAANERLAQEAKALDEILAQAVAAEPASPVQRMLEQTLDVAFQGIGLGKVSEALLAQMKSLGLAFGVAVALRLFLVAPFQIPSGSMIPTLLIGDHLFVFRASYGLQSPFGATPSYLVRWSLPKPGDVVVFQAPPWVPRNGGEDWIKRVIAGPGQRVKRVGLTLYVDDKPYALDGAGKLMRYMDFEETGGGAGRWHESVATWNREDIGGHVHDTFSDIPPATGDWPNGFEPRPDQRGLTCDADGCTVQDGFIFVMGDNRDHSSDGRVWGAVPVDNVRGRAEFIWVSVDGSEESVRIGKFTLPRFRWDRMFDWIA